MRLAKNLQIWAKEESMGFRAVFKKELKLYFVLPSTYVIFSIFLLLSGYFFYTNLVQFNWFDMQRTSSLMEGMYQYYFDDLRLMMTLVLPLLTMRLLSEEKKLGTMELITTYPLRDIDIILGKYLACVAIFSLMLGFTFAGPLLLGYIWGFTETVSVLSGYLGIFLLALMLISCGLFISSLTENQVISAMGTMGVFIFLWFLTWNEMIGSEALIIVLRRFSLFDRVFDFFKGIINTRDVAFFLLGSIYFLYVTHMSVGARQWKGIK
jgi:ABC-2 type transport system permease protein